MKKFMLKIENDMTKADEIAIIDRLEREYLLHPNNYLHDFFTGPNAEWLRQKILDDIFPALPYKMEMAIISSGLEIISLQNELKIRKDRGLDDLLMITDLENQNENMEAKFHRKERELDMEKLAHNHTKNKLIQAEEQREANKLGKIESDGKVKHLDQRLEKATEQIRIAAKYIGAI